MAHINPTARLASPSIISAYVRKGVDNTLIKRAFGAGLKSKGRIETNSGYPYEITWDIDWRRVPVSTNTDMQVINPTRTDPTKYATITHRSYVAAEAMSWMEMEFSKSKQNIYKVLDRVIKVVTKSITEEMFDDCMHNDGNSTSSDYIERIHGWPSWIGNTGSVITNGVLLNTNDTYGTISTALGTYGASTWTPLTSNAWPTGTGDVEYSFWTPMIANSTSTFVGSTATWAAQWYSILRYLANYQSVLRNNKFDAWMMTVESYREALDNVQDQFQIQVVRERGGSDMARMGFGDGVYFDGTELIPIYDVPSGYKAIGVKWDNFTLTTPLAQLVKQDEDIDFDTGGTKKVSMKSLLNLICWNPALTAAVK